MRKEMKRAVALALAAILMPMPVAHAETLTIPAASKSFVSAQNIRKLNIMLMVTSLRCRGGVDDFRSEYDLFLQSHNVNLIAAHRKLTQEMIAMHGPDATRREIDRLGVAMANAYGEGHPVLGCSDLKRATSELAATQDEQQLSQMASALLGHETASSDMSATNENGEPKLGYDPEAMRITIPGKGDVSAG